MPQKAGRPMYKVAKFKPVRHPRKVVAWKVREVQSPQTVFEESRVFLFSKLS